MENLLSFYRKYDEKTKRKILDCSFSEKDSIKNEKDTAILTY